MNNEFIRDARRGYLAARRGFIEQVRSNYRTGQKVEVRKAPGVWVEAEVTFVPFPSDDTGKLQIFVLLPGRKMSTAINLLGAGLDTIRPVGDA